MYFFFYLGFFYEHSRITGLQRKGEVISLTPHYHFHPLHTLYRKYIYIYILYIYILYIYIFPVNILLKTGENPQ